MPVPWDAVYLQLWANFMGAVGARYGTRVSRIGFTGINSTTQEVLLPADPGALANWEDAGYNNAQDRAGFRRHRFGDSSGFSIQRAGRRDARQ